MQVTVQGHQMDVGQALRDHVEETLDNLTAKYFDNAIEARVIFSHSKHLFKADVSVHVGRGVVIQTTADATDIYPAFDAASDKVSKRLVKLKGRMRDHHKTEAMAMAELGQAENDNTPPDTEGDAPLIVAEMPTHIGVMSVAEASMYMSLADLPALMFRNSAHGELNMIYRRADGAVGWVDPKGTLK